MTLGDSWGSELSIEEQKKGISLVLSMTDKGSELLQMADIHLQSVDLTKAVANNHQLEHPSDLPKGRDIFNVDYGYVLQLRAESKELCECWAKFIKRDILKKYDVQFKTGMGNAEERAFITGDGVGKPLGLLAETGGAKVGVTAAQKDAVTFDEIFKLYYALKAPYRKPCAAPAVWRFCMHWGISMSTGTKPTISS